MDWILVILASISRCQEKKNKNKTQKNGNQRNCRNQWNGKYLYSREQLQYQFQEQNKDINRDYAYIEKIKGHFTQTCNKFDNTFNGLL